MPLPWGSFGFLDKTPRGTKNRRRCYSSFDWGNIDFTYYFLPVLRNCRASFSEIKVIILFLSSFFSIFYCFLSNCLSFHQFVHLYSFPPSLALLIIFFLPSYLHPFLPSFLSHLLTSLIPNHFTPSPTRVRSIFFLIVFLFHVKSISFITRDERCAMASLFPPGDGGIKALHAREES